MDARPDDASVVLEVRSVDFGYGPLQVLFDVSLAVHRQEIVALLGTNGAGKTTVLRILSGLESPDRGTVLLGGEDVTALPAERRVRLGIGHVLGGQGVFPSMTVLDNLRAAAFTFMYSRHVLGERLERVLSLFPQLSTKLRQPAASLSGGEQHMLSLAKALLPEPPILLIDELTAGLAPQVVDDLLVLLTNLRDSGTTLLLVEQSLNVAADIADRALFLEKGAVRFEGSPRELLDRPDLARAVFLSSS